MNTNVLYFYSALDFSKCCHHTGEIGRKGYYFPILHMKTLEFGRVKAKQKVKLTSKTYQVNCSDALLKATCKIVRLRELVFKMLSVSPR